MQSLRNNEGNQLNRHERADAKRLRKAEDKSLEYSCWNETA
ncbi:hypothetical protein [Bacillus halotolerans]|nr:hypothetical protein [Bacillus halotolerans]MDP4525097.1 hypothetical protein [Bacillus halotolerans]